MENGRIDGLTNLNINIKYKWIMEERIKYLKKEHERKILNGFINSRNKR